MAQATVETIGKEVLKIDVTTVEWEEISKKFMQRSNFPYGIGAVDRAHILDCTVGTISEQI